LAFPYTRRGSESTFTYVTASALGNSGVCAAMLIRNFRAAAPNWRTFPKVNSRRNEPNVEGA